MRHGPGSLPAGSSRMPRQPPPGRGRSLRRSRPARAPRAPCPASSRLRPPGPRPIRARRSWKGDACGGEDAAATPLGPVVDRHRAESRHHVDDARQRMFQQRLASDRARRLMAASTRDSNSTIRHRSPSGTICQAAWLSPKIAATGRRRNGHAGSRSAPRKPPDWRCHKRGIEAVLFQQLRMRALLDDPALVDHHQPVEPGDRAEPVGDGDHGLAAHQRVELFLDRRLDLRVERRRRLVEHQDRRVLEHDAGQRDPLPLAAGELDATLAGVRVDSRCAPASRAGPSMNSSACAWAAAARDLLVGRRRTPVADVVRDRAVQQRSILGDHADAARRLSCVTPADVLPIDQDARPDRYRGSAAAG